MAAPPAASSEFFLDEEDVLGFRVWAAELELIVGSARGKAKPDARQCFQLLQKLVATLDRTERAEVREYQRRCEDALIDILLKGAPPPVRRLVCEALSKLYSLGDTLPLYSRVSSLQLFLGTKEAISSETGVDVRLGALQCATSLYHTHGRQLSIGVAETAALAAKYCARAPDERSREAALALLAATVEGVGGAHRHALAVQQEAFKAAERAMGGKQEGGEGVRLAAAGVVRALARAGGAYLWASGLAGFEAARALCLQTLGDDPGSSPAVRLAWAQALGELASAASSDAAQESVRALEKKPKAAAAQERALAEVPTQCLASPWVEGCAASARPLCTSLAQAWVCYLSALRASDPGPAGEPALVEQAARVVGMLGAACEAAGGYQERALAPGGEGDLGLGTGSGERPHAQACALYILRVGVIEQLGEGGQRLLLDRLASILTAPGPLGAHTPVGVVTLEALALLLEVLGEVSQEMRAALEPAIGAKVAGPHACLRLQAASAVAALAVAEPSGAARLLAASLANLQAAVGRLVAATSAGPPDRSRPSAPTTPRGVGSAKLKPDMNAVHGWALAAAALVSTASSRLPLGVPSSLLAAALDCAEALIHCKAGAIAGSSSSNLEGTAQPPPQQPSQQVAVQGPVACLQREAGYILLGALCYAAPSGGMPMLSSSVCDAAAAGEGEGPGPGAGAGSTAAAARERLLALFVPGLGPKAAAEMDRRYCSNASNLDHVVAMELWWRTAALQALLAFVQGIVSPAPGPEQAALCKRVAALLKPTMEVVSAHGALQEPSRAKGGPAGMFAGAAALMQLRLLQVYEAIPGASAYAGEQEALTNLCIRAVKTAAAGGAPSLIRGVLANWLHPGDAVLGPQPPARDPLEAALLGFQGVAGGPALHPWEAGLRRGIGYAMAGAAGGQEAGMSSGEAAAAAGGGGRASASGSSSGKDGTAAFAPYPQPRGLGAALMEAQVGLLGNLLAVVAPTNQALIADALLTIANAAAGQAGGKRERDPARRAAGVSAVAAAALAGVAALSDKGSPAPEAAAQLASRLKTLADLALEESGNDVALQRAAADLYAASAALGPDAAALALVRALCRECAETGLLTRRAALALAVGTVSRAVGGLSLQAVLPLAVETLVAVAGASDRSIALWVLQPLLSLADAAGLAYVPHVRRTLDLAQDLLLSEDCYSQLGLLPAIGRLANAMVAVLGPDYRLGSGAYYACKSIINDMRALESAGGSRSGAASDAVAAALESVHYAQMLVLFAPQAVPAASHLPVLVNTLLSRQPRLRRAAAGTLRHLAERDAAAMLAEASSQGGGIVRPLFVALDSETDPWIASQLSAALHTLLLAGAPGQPSRWLALCSEVALAASSTSGGQQAGGGPSASASAQAEALGAGEAEEEEEEESTTHANGSRPDSTAGGGPGSGASPAAGGAAPAAAGFSPRLRTRLFAARLLLLLPGVVCESDPRHADPTALPAAGGTASSSANGTADWLVGRLQQLVETGFRMASGQLEALRPLGLHLLREVVHRFGDAADPLLEGHRLLELYQAQVVSALRASLAAGASPTLSAAGAMLAAAFLEKGLAGGDAAVLERLMGLLSAPLAQWAAAEAQQRLAGAALGGDGSGSRAAPEQHLQAYAEWVYVRERVALLEAHAHCTLLAAEVVPTSSISSDAAGEQQQQQGPDEATRRVVLRAQAPHLLLLMEAWMGLLHDYAVLTWQPPALQQAYRPRLSSSSSSIATGSTSGGAAPMAVLASNAAYLQRAWVVVLGAASCSLAQQQQQAQQAGSSNSGSAASARQEQHAALLDMCQLALCAAAGSEAAAGNSSSGGSHSQDHTSQLQLGALPSALQALQWLTNSSFVTARWVSAAQAAELVSLLKQLLQHVLLPAAGSSAEQRLPLLPAVAEAVAATLQQLGGSSSSDPSQASLLMDAAEACLQLAAELPNASGSATERATASALAAVGLHVRAAASVAAQAPPAVQEAFAATLQRPLLLGVRLASSWQGEANRSTVAAGASLLTDLAAAVGSAGALLPAAGPVLASAAASLCHQVQAAADRAAEQSGAGDGAAAEWLGLLLGSVLALGASLSSTAAAQPAPASPGGAAAGTAGAGAVSEDDWDDDPFAQGEEDSVVAGEGVDSTALAQTEADPGIGGTDEQRPDVSWADEAAAGAGGGGQEQQPEAAAVQLCLDMLQQAALSDTLAVQLQAAQALRAHLQQQQQQQQAATHASTAAPAAAAARAQWLLQCAGVALPGLAARAHGLLQQGRVLSQAELALVSELLKAGLLAVTAAATAAGSSSDAAAQPELQQQRQAALLKVLLPLLVESAAPSGAPTPGLPELALALLTHLASGPAGPAFKAVVADLPPAAKQQLAAALQPGRQPSAASGTQPLAQQQQQVSAAASSAGGRPAIQLKMFAPAPPPRAA